MRFTIYTKPVGQMRARACIRGHHASTYKAPSQEQREQTLAALLAEHRPSKPMSGALALEVDCFLPIPVSKSKSWRQFAESGGIRPTVKPDADNLAKHLKDVMTQVGFWSDDRQVVDLIVRKRYSSVPRWEIGVSQASTLPTIGSGSLLSDSGTTR